MDAINNDIVGDYQKGKHAVGVRAKCFGVWDEDLGPAPHTITGREMLSQHAVVKEVFRSFSEVEAAWFKSTPLEFKGNFMWLYLT